MREEPGREDSGGASFEAMSGVEVEEAEAAPPPSRDDPSIKESIARLIASGREMAEAELAWARVKAQIIAENLRTWLVFAALALVFLVMGVVILIVSAIIALAPYVGMLAANLIVAGVSIVIAIICALVARRAFKTLFEETRIEETGP